MTAEEDTPGAISNDEIDRAILCLCAKRGPERTICPSEAARALVADDAGWRALMDRVRERAAGLAEADQIECLQRGEPVDARAARGAIRLRVRQGN